jgi:Predicted hydrolase (HAD superfamily)
MTKTTEAVLFDVDHTICEYHRSTQKLLSLAFDRADVTPFFEAEEYWALYGEYVGESDSIDGLREQCFLELADQNGETRERGRQVAEAYNHVRDHTNVRFLDGAAEALDQLNDQYRLAAVTNGPEDAQATKLDALGVDQFETVVFAGFETPAKPHPAPFEKALAAVDTTPDNAVFVGNSLEADIAGAHAAGLEAAWLRDGAVPVDGPTPEYVLEEPADLLARPWETAD